MIEFLGILKRSKKLALDVNDFETIYKYPEVTNELEFFARKILDYHGIQALLPDRPDSPQSPIQNYEESVFTEDGSDTESVKHLLDIESKKSNEVHFTALKAEIAPPQEKDGTETTQPPQNTVEPIEAENSKLELVSPMDENFDDEGKESQLPIETAGLEPVAFSLPSHKPVEQSTFEKPILRQGSMQVIHSVTSLSTTSARVSVVGGAENCETLNLLSIKTLDTNVIKQFRISIQNLILLGYTEWQKMITESVPTQISLYELELRDELSTCLFEFEKWQREIDAGCKKRIGTLFDLTFQKKSKF